MTTYVLHGGVTSTESIENEYFFKQFTEHVGKGEVRILMCYWARPRERWQELLERDKPKVEAGTNKTVSFSVAENAGDLLAMMVENDVLYVAGGQGDVMYPYLTEELRNLGKALEGKVYCGSSMGAFIVCRHYILSHDSQEKESVVRDGYNILPLMNLCHWDVEPRKEEKIELLCMKNPGLPVLVLREQETVIFVR